MFINLSYEIYFSTAGDISGFLPLKILGICLGGTAAVLGGTPNEDRGFESLEICMNSIQVSNHQFSNKYITFKIVINFLYF